MRTSVLALLVAALLAAPLSAQTKRLQDSTALVQATQLLSTLDSIMQADSAAYARLRAAFVDDSTMLFHARRVRAILDSIFNADQQGGGVVMRFDSMHIGYAAAPTPPFTITWSDLKWGSASSPVPSDHVDVETLAPGAGVQLCTYWFAAGSIAAKGPVMECPDPPGAPPLPLTRMAFGG